MNEASPRARNPADEPPQVSVQIEDEAPPSSSSSSSRKRTLMGGEFFLGVPVGLLGEELQREEGLAATGWGIDLGVTFQYWWLNAMVDAGFEHYDDSQSFTVTVVDSYGRVFDAESRLNLSYFAPSVGPKTPVLPVIKPYLAVTLGAQIGYAMPFDTSRQIVNCEDCPKDHVSVRGGPFVEPILELLWPSTSGAQLGLAASWQEFLGDSDYERKFVFRAVVLLQNNPDVWRSSETAP